MRKLLTILFFLTALISSGQYINRDYYTNWKGQMGIGTLTQPPAGAWVMIGDSATNKAFILPRVQDTSAILVPRQGMQVYRIADQSMYYRTPFAWVKFGGGLWGNISGSIAAQTDLMGLLNGKENLLTFSNGLARAGNAVKLGGTLTEATTITANSPNVLNINGTASKEIRTTSGSDYANLDIAPNQARMLYTVNGPPYGVNEILANATGNQISSSFSNNNITTLGYTRWNNSGTIVHTSYERNDNTGGSVIRTDFYQGKNYYTFGYSGVGTLSFSIQGLGNTTTSDVLYYNAANGQVTYGAAPTGTGSITIDPIGSSPNIYGATYVNGVLTLQPASATFGGLLTASPQQIGGAKTLVNGLIISGQGPTERALAITGTSQGSHINLAGTVATAGGETIASGLQINSILSSTGNNQTFYGIDVGTTTTTSHVGTLYYSLRLNGPMKFRFQSDVPFGATDDQILTVAPDGTVRRITNVGGGGAGDAAWVRSLFTAESGVIYDDLTGLFVADYSNPIWSADRIRTIPISTTPPASGQVLVYDITRNEWIPGSGGGFSGIGIVAMVGTTPAYVAGTANQLLRRNAGNTAYEFFTPTYLTGNQTITLSGDVAGSGTTAITTTLATVNANVGTWNNVTVNGKGLVTAGSNVAYLTSTPTLKNVLAQGNTTGTNYIIFDSAGYAPGGFAMAMLNPTDPADVVYSTTWDIGGGYAFSKWKAYNSSKNTHIYPGFLHTEQIALYNPNGTALIQTPASNGGFTRYYQFYNDGTNSIFNDTVATLRHIRTSVTPIPTLQQVTTAGSTTTTGIVANTVFATGGSGQSISGLDWATVGVEKRGLIRLNSTEHVFSGTLYTNVLTAGRIYTLPDASGTIALQEWVTAQGYTTSSGVTTMATIGNTPNANGASISGSTLTLQPASSTNGGVLTQSNVLQTIGGEKTWQGYQNFLNGTEFTMPINLKYYTLTLNTPSAGLGTIYAKSSDKKLYWKDDAGVEYDLTATGGGGGMVYPAAGIALSTGTAWGTSITDNSANWNTAYDDRLKWDGGATGLVPATGRTSLGATTVGSNLFTLTNPSAITFPRFNADNTVSALDAATFRTAIGAGTGNGTLTSVSGTTNRITSTGGATPVIDISATFEALLGKVANRIDQNNASTTSAQLLSIISDESGTGVILTTNGSAAALTSFPTFNQSTTGSAATLTTGRTIGMTGDVVWTSAAFNGSANVTGTSAIGTNVVTNAMLAQMPALTIKGNTTAGIANANDLSKTQVTAMLNPFTQSGVFAKQGLVPAPPTTAGSTLFLREDGTWANGTTPNLQQVTDVGFVTTNPLISTSALILRRKDGSGQPYFKAIDGFNSVDQTQHGFINILSVTPEANTTGTIATIKTLGTFTADRTFSLPNKSGTFAMLDDVTGGGGSGADPTATIGLTAINGVATTFMRSDAAPPLSQAIIPTWTATHIFQKNAIGTTSTDATVLQNLTAAAAAVQQYSPRLRLIGQGWKTDATAASVQTEFWMENRPVQGAAAPSSNLVFTSKIGAASAIDQLTLKSDNTASFVGKLGVGIAIPLTALHVKDGHITIEGESTLGNVTLENNNGDLLISNSLTTAKFRLLPYNDHIWFENTSAIGDVVFRNNTYGSPKELGRFKSDGRFLLGAITADPTGANGDLYYNTTNNKFRGYENGAWVNVINSGAGSGDMILASAQTVTGAKTYNSGTLILAGSTSGTTILNAAAVAGSGTVVLPTTGTLATLAGTELLTNKTVNGVVLTTAGSATLFLNEAGTYTTPAGGSQYEVLPSSVTSSATANSLTSATGLAFSGLSGETYRFKFYVAYTSAATTTGSRWTITVTGSTSALSYRSEYSLTATSRTFNEALTATGLPAASNATSSVTGTAAGPGNTAVVEGTVTFSASTTIQLQFASEVASSAITAIANISYVEYQKIN